MSVTNKKVSHVLERIGDLLELKGANPYRIRSYRNAAQRIEGLSRPISRMIDENEDLTELEGIGDDLAGKIHHIIDNGTLPLLEKLEDEVSDGLVEMTKLRGLGPKKTKKLNEALDIEGLSDLEEAIDNDDIKDVEGFGQKTQDNFEDRLESFKENRKDKRFPLADVKEQAENLIKYFEDNKNVKKAIVAGSYRRQSPTVGDLDILVTCHDHEEVHQYFIDFPDCEKVLSQGKDKSSILVYQNLQVDLRTLEEENFGAGLLYFTGSKEHGVELRKLAKKKNYKINEYGLFNEDEKKLAAKTEEAIYHKLGLDYIPPELRENRGEVEAAKEKDLPELIKKEDIRGDLHAHTDQTDGRHSLEDMVKEAQKQGLDYLSITDHTKSLKVTGGLDKDDLLEQFEKIDKINKKDKNFKILKSAEVEILEDGSLDIPDETLKDFDIVLASVHTHRNQSSKEMTKRILKALENPYVHILGHPLGRLLREREPLDFDFSEVLKVASENKVSLEVNAQPKRLDLDGKHLKKVKEMGLKVAISTDAHSTDGLHNMTYGIGQARRGWIEKKDVLNAMTWKELKSYLKR